MGQHRFHWVSDQRTRFCFARTGRAHGRRAITHPSNEIEKFKGATSRFHSVVPMLEILAPRPNSNILISWFFSRRINVRFAAIWRIFRVLTRFQPERRQSARVTVHALRGKSPGGHFVVYFFAAMERPSQRAGAARQVGHQGRRRGGSPAPGAARNERVRTKRSGARPGTQPPSLALALTVRGPQALASR